MKYTPVPIESVEILTLQDNYIDVLAMDSNDVIKRPPLAKNAANGHVVISASPIAEHGFSAFITLTAKDCARHMLFDFGCSTHGAAYNADLLALDLTRVEALSLSHGHMDHFGGMQELVRRTGRDDLECVAHPGVFKKKRYIRTPAGGKLFFPPLKREDFKAVHVSVKESVEPFPLLDGTVLFLGEIPRVCDFEKGMPNAFYDANGIERHDEIEDDSALVFNVKGKGLVVLSGCSHSGIVNTVRYARQVTGVDEIFAVMGGFHLIGSGVDDVITPTIDALLEFSPTYVVPCHCTGRTAVMEIERRMPDAFILNMSATRLLFSGNTGKKD
jgi:7,8-dihydropterin-6-yl-methyl-4-(beta-D-ribofuranosyl)aminobenzene 5'-phosphate synthase